MPRLLNRVLLGIGLAWLALSSFAQTVKPPPPTRTVFKCESGEKVAYSDAPCLGAQKVDVQPTGGLNKSSGSERVDQDVRDERLNEIVADAVAGMLAASDSASRVRSTGGVIAASVCSSFVLNFEGLGVLARHSPIRINRGLTCFLVGCGAVRRS